MRSKESLLNDLKVQANLTDSPTERHLITVNLYLEVLIDIRDILSKHESERGLFLKFLGRCD